MPHSPKPALSVILRALADDDLGDAVCVALDETVTDADDTVGRIRLVKELASQLPHAAEAAIRSWAHTNPAVAAMQTRVDDRRLEVVGRYDLRNDTNAPIRDVHIRQGDRDATFSTVIVSSRNATSIAGSTRSMTARARSSSSAQYERQRNDGSMPCTSTTERSGSSATETVVVGQTSVRSQSAPA